MPFLLALPARSEGKVALALAADEGRQMPGLALHDEAQRLAFAFVEFGALQPLQHLLSNALTGGRVQAALFIAVNREAAIHLADQRPIYHRLAKLFDKVQRQAGLAGPVRV